MRHSVAGGVLLSLGDFTNDAGVAGEGVVRLLEGIRGRGHELTLVVGALFQCIDG